MDIIKLTHQLDLDGYIVATVKERIYDETVSSLTEFARRDLLTELTTNLRDEDTINESEDDRLEHLDEFMFESVTSDFISYDGSDLVQIMYISF